jgi:hypothetical protein
LPANDQAAGLAAKVVQGTIRDSLHMIDVWFSQDAGSHSDLVFGLVSPARRGVYRSALADIPDQKGWRVSPSADYGPLSTFAHGRVDLGRIHANWSDILRVVSRRPDDRPARQGPRGWKPGLPITDGDPGGS